MRRSELRRTGRLPQRSQKRINEQQERTEARLRALERARHTCEAARLVPDTVEQGVRILEAGWPRSCSGRLECDEIIARSQWRAGWIVDRNIQVLCTAHHQWKTGHPELSRELGITKRAHQKDEELRRWDVS